MNYKLTCHPEQCGYYYLQSGTRVPPHHPPQNGGVILSSRSSEGSENLALQGFSKTRFARRLQRLRSE